MIDIIESDVSKYINKSKIFKIHTRNNVIQHVRLGQVNSHQQNKSQACYHDSVMVIIRPR